MIHAEKRKWKGKNTKKIMKQGYWEDSHKCISLIHLNHNKEKTQIHSVRDKKETLQHTNEIYSIFIACCKILYSSKLEKFKHIF